MGDKSMPKYQKHEKRRSIISGTILLGIGIYLLGLQNNWIPRIEDSWPILLIIIGTIVIISGIIKHQRRENDPLSPPPPPNS